MSEKSGDPKRIRFGPYEADLAAAELFKDGRRVRLQEQPFQVLAALLERPADVVTRDELRQRLWPNVAFVDFDQGLNTAINKLRDALEDSAAHPRFVETVPRRGYRFVGQMGRRGIGPSSIRARSNETALIVIGVALGFSVAGVIAALLLRAPSAASLEIPTRRWSFTVNGLQFPELGNPPVAISPNGHHIAYAAEGGLWIKDLDSGKSRRLEGTQGLGPYGAPAWSPDSQFIAFHGPGRITKINAEGGPPITLSDVPQAEIPRDVSWTADGKSILFTLGGVPEMNLFEVPTEGGAARLRREDVDEGLVTAFMPTPTGNALLYSKGLYESDLVVRNFDTGEHHVLGGGALPHYSTSGHVVFQSILLVGGIWALPFSTQGLQATGEAFPIARNGRSPSVSDEGTLVYVENPAEQDQIILLDRGGKRVALVGRPQPFITYPALSPDGRRVAVWAREPETGFDIWIHQVDRPMKTRLTTHDGVDLLPTWSPSGDRIAFSSDRAGRRDLYAKRVDSGEEAQLLFADPSTGQWVTDWSSRGDLVFQRSSGEGSTDLWYLDPKGDGEHEAKPLRQTRFSEQAPALSPDGRLLAFSSDRSGRFEIYVCSFPECDDLEQVSVDGGRQPRWAQEQGGLYFVESNHTMMEATISTQPKLQLSAVSERFTSPYLFVALSSRILFYDVSGDGERFVVVEPYANSGEQSPATIHVWQNWAAGFEDGETK